MIKIEKNKYEVIVELPIETLTFDRTQFELISNNIYFLTRKSSSNDEIVRVKGNIEDLNMGHWLCLKSKYQTNFNDPNLKSLDVEYLIWEHIL